MKGIMVGGFVEKGGFLVKEVGWKAQEFPLKLEVGFYLSDRKVESCSNGRVFRSFLETTEGYFVKYSLIGPMGVFLKGRDQLVIREPKTVIGRVIKLDKSLEKSFINIRLVDTEQVSIVSVKAFRAGHLSS